MNDLGLLIEEIASTIDTPFPLTAAMIFGVIVSFFVAFFIFSPLCQMLFPKNQKIAWITMIAARVSLLIIILFEKPGFVVTDFILFIISIFLILPIYMAYLTFKKINDIKLQDRKYSPQEMKKVKHVISLIFGLLIALIISSRIIIYNYFGIVTSLIFLMPFYTYLYLYEYKYEKKVNCSSLGVDFIILILASSLSVLSFIKPYIVY